MTRSRGYPLAAGWAWFAAICVLALLLRAPIATIPLERDEGEYAYTAQRWLQGDLPYRDAFDQKPPGIFVVYALIEQVGGGGPTALHWGAQFYTLGTLAVLWLLGRRMSSAASGLAAAAFAAFMTTAPGVWGNAANTELFMLLPLTAALLAADRAVERDAPRWALATGACAALALLFKQMAITTVVFYAMFLAVRARRRASAIALMGLGLVGILGVACAYFVAHGAGPEFYDATIGYNLHYAARAPLADYPHHLWLNLLVVGASFWPFVILAAAQLTRACWGSAATEAATARRTRQRTFWVAAWLAASLAGTASGGYFTPHYFMQTVPALALLAGMAVGETRLQPLGEPLRPFVQAAFVLGTIGVGILTNRWYYTSGDVAGKLARLYGDTPFADSPAVARFIRERSTPTDSVFVLGSEPQILYYADRRSATRYFYIYPLAGPYPNVRQRQEEAWREITHNQPRFVITVFLPKSFLGAAETPRDIVDRVRDLLDQSYQLVGVLGYTDSGGTEFATGARAAEAWRRAPVWYGMPSWCALAVWERDTLSRQVSPPPQGEGSGN